MPKNNFHHGNLRSALIEAAVEVVNTSGIESLSLRQLAEKLGVSPAAPYRHFANKNALIAALVDYGASEMIHGYKLAHDSSADSELRLYNGCKAYIQYAAEKTNMFNMLFSDYAKLSSNTTSSIEENEAFQRYQDLVTDLISLRVPKSRHRQITISCWALMHGFATLHVAGNLETSDYKMDNAITAIINLVKSAK